MSGSTLVSSRRRRQRARRRGGAGWAGSKRVGRQGESLQRAREGHRMAEVVALRLVDAERAKGLELALGLDSFGGDGRADPVGEVDQRGGQGTAPWIRLDLVGEAEV